MTLEHSEQLIRPSQDMAWMLGALSGGGHVGRGKIIMYGSEQSLIDYFKRTGESLFKVNCFVSTLHQNPAYKVATFHSVVLAERLGNLGRLQWPQTMRNNHAWVLGNNRYLWRFLEGLLDTRGSYSQNKILFNTSYPEVANYIAELLIHVGLQRPRVKYKTRLHDSILGTAVDTLDDCRLLARNVHIKIPRLEARLEEYRVKGPSREGQEINEIIIQEWAHIWQEIGHSPAIQEIIILKKQGQTRFDPGVYSNHFGLVAGKRSYREARRSLDLLLKKRGNISEDQSLDYKRKVPTKISPRISDDALISEWCRVKNLLGRTPGSYDFAVMRRRGETRYSKTAYLRRFGLTDSGFSHISAKDVLTAIYNTNNATVRFCSLHASHNADNVVELLPHDYLYDKLTLAILESPQSRARVDALAKIVYGSYNVYDTAKINALRGNANQHLRNYTLEIPGLKESYKQTGVYGYQIRAILEP